MSRSSTRAGWLTLSLLVVGCRQVPGAGATKDATSGGRLVRATGVLLDTGFGLVAPTGARVPRLTAAEAYARLVASPDGTGPPELGAGPVVILATATMSFSKPSHDALVWVFVWPDQQCFSAGAAIDNRHFPQSPPVPTVEACTSYVLMSDTTGTVVTAGDG